MCVDSPSTWFSVIAPAFNEAGCLPALTEAIRNALIPLEQPFEIILVDDASTDHTSKVIHKLSEQFPEVRGVFHQLRCGQSAAVVSGFHTACGRLLITLDADMQNPPSEIPKLLTRLTSDIDAVCGMRSKRNDRFIRRLSSQIANRFRNIITGIQVSDAGCGMRLIRREAARELPVFNGLHRFITTILKLQGFSVTEVAIEHSERFAGKSKYGINNRLWRGIADCFAMRWYARRVIPAKRSLETE